MVSYRQEMKDILLKKYRVMDLEILNSILNEYEDSRKGLNDLIYDLEDIGNDAGIEEKGGNE
jgi:hypothetical protein